MNLTERIESVILSNLQAKEERRIGIECECILYNNKMQRIPVNPSSEISSTDILNELVAQQSNDEIKSNYTLEPGGQIEWASPPLKTLHEINKKFMQHKSRTVEIAKREKLYTIDYSLEPIYEPLDIPIINNEKYQLMNKTFMKTGELGPWMMRNTASIQINIDYSSREEAERMAFIIDSVTPIISIFFANCPFWKGRPAGKANLRYKIWTDTDNSRCGYLLDHGIDSTVGIVSKYADYIQTVPAIFILDKNGNIIEYNGTLGEWLKELELAGKLTNNDIQVALHQIFTHVRFKNVLEIRGCDKPPAGYELAPVALWIGLLFDDKAQNEIFNIVKKWNISERRELNKGACILDLEQLGPQNRTNKEWIDIITDISKNGLINRNINLSIENEVEFLTDYLEYYGKNGIPAIDTQNKAMKSGKTVRDFIK
jgi:glutamate--cysteine ligase